MCVFPTKSGNLPTFESGGGKVPFLLLLVVVLGEREREATAATSMLFFYSLWERDKVEKEKEK